MPASVVRTTGKEQAMIELGQKTPEKLAAENAALLGPLGEPSLREQVIEMFRGINEGIVVATEPRTAEPGRVQCRLR